MANKNSVKTIYCVSFAFLLCSVYLIDHSDCLKWGSGSRSKSRSRPSGSSSSTYSRPRPANPDNVKLSYGNTHSAPSPSHNFGSSSHGTLGNKAPTSFGSPSHSGQNKPPPTSFGSPSYGSHGVQNKASTSFGQPPQGSSFGSHVGGADPPYPPPISRNNAPTSFGTGGVRPPPSYVPPNTRPIGFQPPPPGGHIPGPTHIQGSHSAPNAPPLPAGANKPFGVPPPPGGHIPAPTHIQGSHSSLPSAPPLPHNTNQRPIGFQPPPPGGAKYPQGPPAYSTHQQSAPHPYPGAPPAYHAPGSPSYHAPPSYNAPPPSYNAPSYHPPAYHPPSYQPPPYHPPSYSPYGGGYGGGFGGGYGGGFGGGYGGGFGGPSVFGGSSYGSPMYRSSSGIGGKVLSGIGGAVAGVALWELLRNHNNYNVHRVEHRYYDDPGRVSRVDKPDEIHAGDTYIVTPNNVPCNITETKTENGRQFSIDCKSADTFNATVILPSNSTAVIPCSPGSDGKGCVGTLTVNDEKLKPVNFDIVNATALLESTCRNITNNGTKEVIPPECYPIFHPPANNTPTAEYWEGFCKNLALNLNGTTSNETFIPQECNDLWYPPSYWQGYCTTLQVRLNGTITNETVIPPQCYKIWYPPSYWQAYCRNLTGAGAKLNQSDIPQDCYNIWAWEDYCYNLSIHLNPQNKTNIPQECYDIWYPNKEKIVNGTTTTIGQPSNSILTSENQQKIIADSKSGGTSIQLATMSYLLFPIFYFLHFHLIWFK